MLQSAFLSYIIIMEKCIFAGHHYPVSPGSLTLQDNAQSSSASATSLPQQTTQSNGDTATSDPTPTKLPSPLKSSSKQVPEFDSSVEAMKLTWKLKRLYLCELICKHSPKDFSKELKLSNAHRGTPKRRRRSSGDPVKLTFHLYPHGFGRDEGSFMSMRVCVRVDSKMYLKDMAAVHLRITTKLPPSEFVTVRTTSNSLEDFVLNDFIPHDIIINQTSKNVEFLIEAYLTYDTVRGERSAAEKEFMDSLTLIEDKNDDDFLDLGEVIAGQ